MIDNNYMFKFNIHTIIFYMLCVYLVIDSINGVLVREGFYSISVPYKLIILALALAYIQKPVLSVFIFMVISCYLIVHFFISDSFKETVNGIVFIVRFFAIVIYYQFFITYLKNEVDAEKKILFFATISFSILAANLIAGVAGYGYAQYTDGDVSIGSRGFIYAGNELAGAFIVSAAIVLMINIQKNNFVKYFSFGLVFISMSLLATTKLAVLSSLLIFVLFPFVAISGRLSHMRISVSKTSFAVLILLVFPMVFVSAMYFVLYEMNLIERLSHFYNRLDFITFMLSGRDVRAGELLTDFATSYSLTEIILGKPTIVISEIDPVDMLIKYGFVGLFIVYSYFLYILFSCLFDADGRKYRLYVSFMVLLLLGASSTAGHIVYSGVAGPLFAALFALGMHRNRKRIV